MAIQNKSEGDTQQLSEKASLILQNRRHSVPVKMAAGQALAEQGKVQDDMQNNVQDNAGEKILNQQHSPESPPATQANRPGLRQRLRAVPGLGYALAWCQALIRLPRTRFQTEVALAHLQWKIDGLQGQLQALNQRIAEGEQRIADIESKKLEIRLDQYDALDIGKRLMEFDRLHIARQLRSVNLLMRNNLQHNQSPGGQIQADTPLQREAQETVVPGKPAIMSSGKPDSDFDKDQFYLEF